eukprot:8598328-Ditylum_brightwellii.AAC.1
MDDMMSIIDTDSRPRAAARKKFVDSIGSNKFPMLVYKYRLPGRATNWVVVFKLPKNTKLKNPKVMECISKANDSAPQYLSCQLTNDGLTKICSMTGSNSKKTALAILDALLPDNVISNLDGYTEDDVEQVNELIKLI